MYKNYFMYNGDMYSKLVKEKEERRSAIVSPTTHTYVNSTYNMLLDNIVTVDMRTVPNASDREADEEFLKEVTDIFIPYMEEKEGYVENMHSSMFDTVLLGCTSASLGWSDIDEKITYMSPSSGSIEGIKLSESYPVREYK